MLEFNILKGQYLNRLDKNVVSADTTDLKAQFDLTSDFTGTITVWWRRSDVNNTYTSTLAADGTCTIPAEALAATDKAVYGPYDHDVFVSISDTGRTTTNEYKLTVLRSAFSTNSTPGTGGSPTAYEELVEQFDELKDDNEQFKTDITEQQETFESTVTENVDNILYVVETETAPPIIDEASGAEITLDDSAYRQVRDLQLYGYSKQTQTTGAQLLDYSTLSGAQNGITPSIDDDNYIVLNGTATANAFIYVLCSIPSGTSMFISVNNPVLNNNISVYIRDEESTYSSEYIALDTANKTHAFASVSVAISRLVIRVVQGTTLTNFRLRPMLNAGTSALPWEPYSGGVASPSPDWAQPIHSVADKVNLLNFPDMESVAADGVTWSCKDGVVSVTGNATGQANTIYSLFYLFPIKAGTYKISGANDKILIIARITKSDDSFEYLEAGFTLGGTEKEVRIYVRAANTGAISSTIYPMINSGTTALPYRPYGHNVTVESAGANLINPYAPVSSAGMTDNDDTYSLNRGARNSAVVAYSIEEYKHVLRKYSSLQTRVRISSSVSGQTVYNDVYPDAYSTDVHIDPGASMSEKTSTISIKGDILEAPYANYRIYTTEYGTVTVAKDIMVNAGDTPLPYVPYVAPSSALITLTDSLRGIPVSSGGNYTDESGQQWIADYIYRRQTDGKWMLWRSCGKTEYDGSEDEAWSQSSSVSYRFIISGSTSPALSAAIASSFKVSTKGTTDVGQFVVNDGINSRYFNSNQNSLEAWKTWLAENPQTVVYQLATPTVEELPENVQTELNGLYTYNLHTDMWNSDGAYMGLKYVADTKTWINNKIAGLSTAMLNQN